MLSGDKRIGFASTQLMKLWQMTVARSALSMLTLQRRRCRIDGRLSLYEREGGQIKLLVESGLDSAKQDIGIPYGVVARMILVDLQT